MKERRKPVLGRVVPGVSPGDAAATARIFFADAIAQPSIRRLAGAATLSSCRRGARWKPAMRRPSRWPSAPPCAAATTSSRSGIGASRSAGGAVAWLGFARGAFRGFRRAVAARPVSRSSASMRRRMAHRPGDSRTCPDSATVSRKCCAPTSPSSPSSATHSAAAPCSRCSPKPQITTRRRSACSACHRTWTTYSESFAMMLGLQAGGAGKPARTFQRALRPLGAAGLGGRGRAQCAHSGAGGSRRRRQCRAHRAGSGAGRRDPRRHLVAHPRASDTAVHCAMRRPFSA